MRKILLIIKREYLTRVRTKGFIIGTVIVPLIGVGSILLVVFLVGHTASQTSRIEFSPFSAKKNAPAGACAMASA